MKSAREIMDMLEAFDLTGSYRAAAELAGCDHKTVKHRLDRGDAGLPPEAGVEGSRLIDPQVDKLDEWMARSNGRLRADAAHDRLAWLTPGPGRARGQPQAGAGAWTASNDSHSHSHSHSTRFAACMLHRLLTPSGRVVTEGPSYQDAKPRRGSQDPTHPRAGGESHLAISSGFHLAIDGPVPLAVS
jgi:hypothetical protein